jgi:ABC-type phosphate/phosphonate transport system substrate-binding protein
MTSSLTFGYFAQEETTRAASERLREWMSEKLGFRLELHFAGGYEALTRDVESGKVDMAWLPPVAYVKADPTKVTPLLALVRGRQTGYQGALVVRSDAPYERLEDLRNARAAVGRRLERERLRRASRGHGRRPGSTRGTSSAPSLSTAPTAQPSAPSSMVRPT